MASAENFRDLLSTRPTNDAFKHHESDALDWRGRASALFKSLGAVEHFRYRTTAQLLDSNHPGLVASALREVEVLIREIVHELSDSEGTLASTIIDAGKPYDYFEALSSVIALAKEDLLFVDPYADQKFISTYVRHISARVSVRLMVGKYGDAVDSAVSLLKEQSGQTISVQSHLNLHDRFIFIDGSRCFHSGASFKDGGKKSTTVISEIQDLTPLLVAQYEKIWADFKN